MPTFCRLAASLLVTVVAGSACTVAAHAAPEATSVEQRHGSAASPTDPVLVIHYHRPDDTYAGWNLWTWPHGGEGGPVRFGGETRFGRYAVIEPPLDAERQGFIVRLNEWEARDWDADRFVTLDDDGFTEVWLVAGDPAVYTDPANIDLSPKFVSAFLDDSDSINVTFTGSPEIEDLKNTTITLRGGDQSGRVYRVADVGRAPIVGTRGVIMELELDRDVAFDHVSDLMLTLPGGEPVTVYARDVLTEDRFTALDVSFGPHYLKEGTTFRVWSPVSGRVELLLDPMPGRGAQTRSVEMQHKGRGVWEATVGGDLHGVPYRIAYHSYGSRRVAADIHCFAATADSSRSVVIDFDRVNPEGWGTVEPPRLESETDEVIYEIHVRDFTVRDRSLTPELRGTYAGLTHRGEVETPNGTVQTGLNHLEELGVTAVHLLPIHDFGGDLTSYNWGYWTSLFNVPETAYATDHNDPMSAVHDLKAAIHGLHEADIRVILDVVYNHTSSSGTYSPFYQSVPYYWFRTTPDGRLRNDAGVGNSIADERPMVRKYIGDSLVFWATEYRVDGYRFDLLGTHHPGSVREWMQRLAEVREDLTIYGEPWTGGGPVYFGKGAQRGMGIAVFNDHFRNALRGDLDGTAQGYANGPWGDVGAVRTGVSGAIDDFADDPTETVNYVSAHDNLTLWDKLLLSNPDASEEQLRAMQKLAHGIVLTSQGIAFIHGGADFARTKGGNHNSYNAGDDVNLFDWDRKGAYGEVFEYVRGLIELRREHPGFRMADRADVRRAIRFMPASTFSDERVIGFRIAGEAAGDDWGSILVVYNGTPEPQEARLGSGEWTQVVDHERAGTEAIRKVRGTLSLRPYSMAVLHR